MTVNKRPLSGVGINDADYAITRYEVVDGKNKIVWVCPFYQVWASMIQRGHSKRFKLQFTSYKECYVDERWHRFTSFKLWMETQDWQGKSLDKDLLIPGNKRYGPDTCVFLNQKLNKFLTDGASRRGKFPLGVCLHKKTGRLVAACGKPETGRNEHLGLFDCPQQAHEAWRSRKHEHACRYADQQTDPRIADALRSRYAPLQGGIP